MRRDDFLAFVERKTTELVETSRAAQKEYAYGKEDDCFNNFNRTAAEVDAHPMKVEDGP